VSKLFASEEGVKHIIGEILKEVYSVLKKIAKFVVNKANLEESLTKLEDKAVSEMISQSLLSRDENNDFHMATGGYDAEFVSKTVSDLTTALFGDSLNTAHEGTVYVCSCNLILYMFGG